MSEIPISTEAIPSGSQMLEQMKDARWQSAEVRCVGEMRRLLDGADRIAKPKANLLNAREDASTSLEYLDIAERVALDANGITIGKDYLSPNGVTFHSKVDGPNVLYALDAPDMQSADVFKENVTDVIRKRYSLSPLHKQLHTFRAEHPTLEVDFSLPPFSLDEDPMATIVFLNEIGFVSSSQLNGRLRELLDSGVQGGALLEEVLDNPGGEIIAMHPQPGKRVLQWGEGVARQLVIDDHDRTASLNFELRPEAYYREKANKHHAKGEPFVETQCAAELFDALSNAGLMLHPDFQKLLVSTAETSGYGSFYTTLSRHIANVINQQNDRGIDGIFVPFDAQYFGEDLMKHGFDYSAHQYEQDEMGQDLSEQVRAKLKSIETSTMSEAAGLLINLTQAVIGRTKFESELPPSKIPPTERNGLRYGACYDLTTYILDGMVESPDRDGLTVVNVGGVPLIRMGFNNAKNYITMRPTTINGVEVPKGTLLGCNRTEDNHPDGDGGWFVKRLTPFTFDQSTDRKATGTELLKSADVTKVPLVKLMTETSLEQIIRNAQNRS